MGRETQETIFQRHFNDQMYEKVLSMTNHQDKANQIHSVISADNCQNGVTQRVEIPRVAKGINKTGTLMHC